MWFEIARVAGLFAFVGGAIIGQAELIGEPWRHYVTIICVIAAATQAYLMKPGNLQASLKRTR